MTNRYFVGAGGDNIWGNTNIWSEESGGTSGASVPTINDDVYFDDKSPLKGISIRDANAYCNNFYANDLTNNVGIRDLYDGYGVGLNINGSCILNSHIVDTVGYENKFNFISTNSSNTITNNGSGISWFVFNGIGGKWIFQDGSTTLNRLDIINGNVNTNNFDFSLASNKYSSRIDASSGNIELGSSIIGTRSWTGGTNNINAGTSTINLLGGGSTWNFYGGTNRYYDVIANETVSNRGNFNGRCIFHNLTFDYSVNSCSQIRSATSMSAWSIYGTFTIKGKSGTPLILNGNSNSTIGGIDQILFTFCANNHDFDYVDFRNIVVEGHNLPFVATNSIGSGNNINIFTMERQINYI